MKKKKITDRDVHQLEFNNRESGIHHVSHRQDMEQYELVKAGDPRAAEAAIQMISSEHQGHLSDDPLQNIKYLFACGAALATRVCIQGGLNEETAQDISDLFIRKMDLCTNREDVIETFGEMFNFFSDKMRELQTAEVYSRPIVEAVNYIYQNLHQPIRLQQIADAVHLNPSYLSTLFRKETGYSVSEYILNKRIESAENLLRYSPFTYLEISNYLAFSTQSHFTMQFKKVTGYTPKEYRNAFFRESQFDR